MIAKVNKIGFLKGFFVNLGLFFAFLEGFEIPEENFKYLEKRNLESNNMFDVIDIEKIGLNTSSFLMMSSFDVSVGGNILYKDVPVSKMYPNDIDEALVKNFSFGEIPKVYLQSIDKDSLRQLFKKFDVNMADFTPLFSQKIVGLSGECGNSLCNLAEKKIEKETIIAVGGEAERGSGILYYDGIVNANNIVAIGGKGKYADGFENVNGFISANRLIAIGGEGGDADGFYNESGEVNIRNIVAIGGKNGGNGFKNRQILNVNSISAIGGLQESSFGLDNFSSIKTNLLVAIGGEYRSPGVYNQKKIQADMIVSFGGNKKGRGILNVGKIDTNTLVLIGDKTSIAFHNHKVGTLNAENIYLYGSNALYNDGIVKTSNLIVNDFSSIRGDLETTNPLATSIIFNIVNKKWDTSKAYLSIKDGNLTLQQNTSVSVVFSDDKILENNLSYDKIYKLLEIKNGQFIDKRSNKQIEFEGLDLKPVVKINNSNILFSFNKSINHNIFDTQESNLINKKLSSLGIHSIEQQEKIIQKLSSISPNASKILTSIIQSNARGGDFQQVAIDEGLKKFDSDSALLKDLITQTDKTLEQNSVAISIFSQKNIEYVNRQVSDRINMLSFEKILQPSLSELSRKYALASNTEGFFIPDLENKNSAWINIGGSYYQNASASSIASSISSLNVTLGYDRRMEAGKDSDIVLGALFNYAKSFYAQRQEKETFDTYALGIYSDYAFGDNEIQAIISGTWLVGSNKVSNEKIGINPQYFSNNNTAFNTNIFYKYKIALNEKHSIKPLVLGNYSLLYTPLSSSENFTFKDSLDFVFALGAGGEYVFQTSKTGHIVQFSGRYHFQEIDKTRAIAFKSSDVFINYDLNPSRTWLRLSYNAKFYLLSALSIDISLIGDMSLKYDFLGMGNVGLNYTW
ncbi:autotransporter outer membrane beta-barrel domain-containing protein [Helicobacter sp. 13S00477-4]|uniref:autotransporter outer membrane beta-barrel domain-containing protein n=1 Tax=Helicobacter sp. 13S00477-4 TaxID=1905759 RepID=UPI000BA791DC|nr:autotransporter outer membrane beta-barrel domain-containing protein [Helicobacter sp. 13S00477-4]PAF50655.1 hypothetical protein BKH44_06915 [Helicobacter sp. 13S00477-4]